MGLRAQVLSALKWTVIGRLSTQFVSWAITILVMRLLVPDDYGLVAMAAIFSGFFALVAEVGLGSSLVQSKEVSVQQLRQVFAIVLLSNFGVFAILAFAIAPLSAFFFEEPRLEVIIQIIALQFFPAAFAILPGAILDREMKYRGRSFVDFFSNLLGGLLTLGLAYEGYGAWSLAWGTVLVAILRSAGLNWLKPYKELPSFDFSGVGQLFRFGRDVAATQFVYYFYAQADSLIVGKLLGRHDLGLYSVSMNLASLPASRIASILNQVAFPAMSKVKRDGGDVNLYLLKSIRGISLLAFPIMWGMSSVSTEIVNGFLGDNWVYATTSLSILCLIMPLRVLGPIVHAGLQSVGRADVSFRNTCTTAVVMCISFVIGCQFGLIGLAWAWACAFPAVFFANVYRACEHLDLTLVSVVSALYKPVLVSALMYGAVMAARSWLTLSPLPMLGTLVFTGGMTYLGGSLVFNREGVTEAMGILRPTKT